jgi:hypothetical protein
MRAGDAVAVGEALKACSALAWAEVAPLYEALNSRIPQLA